MQPVRELKKIKMFSFLLIVDAKLRKKLKKINLKKDKTPYFVNIYY